MEPWTIIAFALGLGLLIPGYTGIFSCRKQKSPPEPVSHAVEGYLVRLFMVSVAEKNSSRGQGAELCSSLPCLLPNTAIPPKPWAPLILSCLPSWDCSIWAVLCWRLQGPGWGSLFMSKMFVKNRVQTDFDWKTLWFCLGKAQG